MLRSKGDVISAVPILRQDNQIKVDLRPQAIDDWDYLEVLKRSVVSLADKNVT